MTTGWNIVVCVKQGPDADEVSIDPDTGTLNRADAAAVLNRPDWNAVEAALDLRDAVGGTVTALTMGPPTARAVLATAVGLGCDDGVLLTDRAFAFGENHPRVAGLHRKIFAETEFEPRTLSAADLDIEDTGVCATTCTTSECTSVCPASVWVNDAGVLFRYGQVRLSARPRPPSETAGSPHRTTRDLVPIP